MRNLLKVLIFVTVINNVLVLKWHYLSDWIVPLECATRLVALMIANEANYNYTNIGYLYVFGIMIICYYNDKGSQLLMITLTYAIHITFGQAVVYQKPYEAFSIVEVTLYVIFFFITCSLMAMSFVHIGRLHNELD